MKYYCAVKGQRQFTGQRERPVEDLLIFQEPTYLLMNNSIIGSSSPYESNRASPTGGRRPLPFKRDLMGLSLSMSLSILSSGI
jgi:hypothetical protein